MTNRTPLARLFGTFWYAILAAPAALAFSVMAQRVVVALSEQGVAYAWGLAALLAMWLISIFVTGRSSPWALAVGY